MAFRRGHHLNLDISTADLEKPTQAQEMWKETSGNLHVTDMLRELVILLSSL